MLHFRESAESYRVKVCEKYKRTFLVLVEHVQCINYFGVSGQANPATVAVPRDEPQLAQLQPSFTYFPLIHIKYLGRSQCWSQRSQE